MSNTIGRSPPPVDVHKGTRVADMPAPKGEKNPASMKGIASQWLQNPLAQAAQTISLTGRRIQQLRHGELPGPREASVAADSVKKSLDMLKGGAMLEGLADRLIPPPGKAGAGSARPGPTRAAWKLSNFFNTAALSFRDAAAQRSVPQFRFRGTPPDARWTEGALNTDFLQSTLKAQLSDRAAYGPMDLAALLQMTDQLLLSDHTLTPGAVEFCEEIRNALADEVAHCGALQAGESRLTDLLQATVRNAAGDATSAYVLAKDVCAYAQARQAALGPSLSAVLQPAEAALLASIKAAPERFADLPETARGQLREACHTLFGANETKEIFARVDQQRLSTAADKLKSVLENLPTDTRAAATGLDQAEVLARRIGGMRADLPKPLMTLATADIIASAARSKLVPAHGEALATALVSADKGEISTALTPIKPLLNLLSSLPNANQEQVAKAFMAGALEQLSLDDLGKIKAALFPKSRASAPPPEGLTVFKQGLSGVLSACVELRKVSTDVESASHLLTAAEPKDPKALHAALKKLADVPARTLNDSTVSEARRRAVQQEIEALKATLRSASDHLVAHFDAINDIADTESIYQTLIRLNVFMPPGVDGKAQRPADPRPASQDAVEAVLNRSQKEFAQACVEQLQEAASSLREPFMPGQAVEVLEVLDAAARADVISHRLQRLLGLPDNPGAWRAERLKEAGIHAPTLSDEAREAAQDLLSVLETVSRPVEPQPSALAERLDALKTYLKGFGLNPTADLPVDRRQAAATALHEACGVRIVNGVPFDDRSMHAIAQEALDQIFASAVAEYASEGAQKNGVSAQASRDLSRTTIAVDHHGQIETLNQAYGAPGARGDAKSVGPQASIEDRLRQALGNDPGRFWRATAFMTQTVTTSVVTDYLFKNPDSPIRHQFGPERMPDYAGAPTQATLIPGETADTVKLVLEQARCRLVTDSGGTQFIDLDPDRSRLRMAFEIAIPHDGSAVSLRKLEFDLVQHVQPQTAQGAARIYVNNLDNELNPREARGRALELMRTRIEPSPADAREQAKAIIGQAFRRLPSDRRLAHLEMALALLPANDSESPADPLSLGVNDAIRQEYFATVHGIELAALGALNAPNHTVNGTDIGVAEDLWKDFSRFNHYELRSPVGPNIAFAGAGDDTQNALSALKAMAVRLGPTEQAGREKLARIGKYAHQGIWPMILIPHFSAASPFKLNGRPGGWLGPHLPARYLIEPLDNGAHRVTCTMRWRGTPDSALNFKYADGEMEELSSDSYAQGRIVLQVNEDGSVQLEEPPSIECQFLPKPTTVMGRLNQAIRAFSPPSL